MLHLHWISCKARFPCLLLSFPFSYCFYFPFSFSFSFLFISFFAFFFPFPFLYPFSSLFLPSFPFFVALKYFSLVAYKHQLPILRSINLCSRDSLFFFKLRSEINDNASTCLTGKPSVVAQIFLLVPHNILFSDSRT